MHLHKEDAEELLQNARQIINHLQEWKPESHIGLGETLRQINTDILDLEYNLEKLEEAINNDPTKSTDYSFRPLTDEQSGEEI